MVLSGCNSSKPADPAKPAGDTAKPKSYQLILATGGTAGTYYPLGGSMAQIFNKKISGMNMTAQATGASVENMQLLQKGDVDLAMTQNDIADYAINGTEAFKTKLTNINAIATLYPEVIQIIVPVDSPIKSVKDMKGKKISVGAPGSGNEANARQILAAYGLTYNDIDEQLLSYAESADSFKDGNIDAIFFTTGMPNSAIQDMNTSRPIKILQMDADGIKNLQAKYPFYQALTIPKGTYKGIDQDIQTVTVLSILTVSSKADTDLVYNITKNLMENAPELAQASAKANSLVQAIKDKNTIKGITIPLHPGAIKYYQEKGLAVK
jgi:TRAP transporter TAXI family solute receptor